MYLFLWITLHVYMSFNEGKITLTFFFFCVRATILGTQDQAEITSNTSLVLKKVAPFLQSYIYQVL